jgi:ubiquinol-cytochrome c reductase cytochrome c subunit
MSLRVALVLMVAPVAFTPVASAAGDNPAAAGKRLFGRYCVACHGANGAGVARPRTAGAGPLHEQTTQRVLAPSLHGVGALAPDFYLRTGYMPLQKIGQQPRRRRVLLDDTQIRALVAYVASLGKGPAIPRPRPERGNLSEGMRLFTAHCAACHQVVAAGGYVTGAVPPSLAADSPTQIAEAVRIGPYVMPTFTKKALDDRELDSIIRYVQYAKDPDDRGGWSIGHLGPIPEGLVTWFVAATALVLVCLALGRRLHS